jgi:hypothetical protein
MHSISALLFLQALGVELDSFPQQDLVASFEADLQLFVAIDLIKAAQADMSCHPAGI